MLNDDDGGDVYDEYDSSFVFTPENLCHNCHKSSETGIPNSYSAIAL